MRPGADLTKLNAVELQQALDRHYAEAEAALDNGEAYIGDDGRLYRSLREDES